MKIWLIVAACLVAAGAIVFCVAMTLNQWDFRKLETVVRVTNEATVTEPFENIRIDTDTADIRILPSEDGSVKVVCAEEDSSDRHTVSVTDGTLTVSLTEDKKWYHHIHLFSWESPSVTVYLPEGEYASLAVKASTAEVKVSDDFTFESVNIRLSTGDASLASSVKGLVEIKTSTGAILCEGLSAGRMNLSATTGTITLSEVNCPGAIELSVDTGKNRLENVTCLGLTSEGRTGDITLVGVVASGKIEIERSTGDVIFEGCDAREIDVDTDTGHVKGSFLSDKIFYTKTDTGKVTVPHSTKGDICEVETDTGNINLWICE